MKSVLGWALAVGFIWLIAVGVTTAALTERVYDPDGAIHALNNALIAWGPGIGSFLAGPITLALVLLILQSVAERMGFRFDGFAIKGFSLGANVQATIALIIIGSFAVSALAGVGQIGPLKDIALVVVGFYFGQRKHNDELRDMATSAAEAAVDSQASDTRAPTG
jgi:hypothetical protein